MRRVNRRRRSSVRRRVRHGGRAVHVPAAHAMALARPARPRSRAIGLACAIAICRVPGRAGTGAGAGREVSRRTISKIEFEGNATITADKIKPKLLSRVGQPLDQDKVEADLKTLMGTKWFSDVRYYLDESPPKSGKYALIFVVREMPLLTKVEFRGRKAIRLKEIEDTTGLKAGNRADPIADPAGRRPDPAALSGEGLRPGLGHAARRGQSRRHQDRDRDLRGAQGQGRQHQLRREPFRLGARLADSRSPLGKPILGLFGKYHRDMLDEDRQKLIDYYYATAFSRRRSHR